MASSITIIKAVLDRTLSLLYIPAPSTSPFQPQVRPVSEMMTHLMVYSPKPLSSYPLDSEYRMSPDEKPGSR